MLVVVVYVSLLFVVADADDRSARVCPWLLRIIDGVYRLRTVNGGAVLGVLRRRSCVYIIEQLRRRGCSYSSLRIGSRRVRLVVRL